MSVLLNESALQFLLENPAGPVGIDLMQRSEVIVRNGESIAALIIEDAFIRPNVDYEISNSDLGLQSVIGIPYSGSVSEYLALKFDRESDWIVPSLFSNWGAMGSM